MSAMDETITRSINSLAGTNSLLDTVMIAATRFGVPLLVLLVVAQWWSRNDRPRVRHACVAAGLSFLIGLGLNQIILLFIHRPRPYDAGVSHLIISRSTDWSFPSDHATATIAIAAAFLLYGMRGRALGFLMGAVLICVSRVYVGIHYVTDVLGGAATGFVAAAAVRSLYSEGTRIDRFITGLL